MSVLTGFDTTTKTFAYTAYDAGGTKRNATMEAPSQGAVIAELQRQGWIPVTVTESKKGAGQIDLTAWITGGGVKFKWAQRAEFARRLNQMLRAGISPSKALVAMGEDAPKMVTAMCNEMAEKVMAGIPLSEAMAEHPRAFDEVTIAYVASGEQSGTLVPTTERLAIMLAKRAALQSKIKGVSAYPKLVGGAIGILTMGIIMFLVPMYAKIYASFNAKLPAPTRILMSFSKHFLPFGFKTYRPLGADGLGIPFLTFHPFSFGMIGVILFAGIFTFRKKTKNNLEIGKLVDRIWYRLPLVGALSHKQSLQRWASTLSGALASGVAISKAVDLAARSAGGRWHRWIAPQLAEAIRTGRTLSSEVSRHPDLYPPNVRMMMTTGENTGELDTMLDSVADALDNDIDSIVAGLSAKIEVALLLVLGAVVGGLLLVLYMPILNLATTASKGLSS